MNKTKRKFLDKFIEWLDGVNSNKYINIFLMAVIIVSISAFFFSTFPESAKRIQILIIPLIAGLDIYLLGSKNHIIRETANFIAGLLFIGFLFFSLVLISMGLVVLRSL